MCYHQFVMGRCFSCAAGLAILASTGCSSLSLTGEAQVDCEHRHQCAPEGIYPGACTERHDDGGDGIAEQCTRYEYDDRCLVSLVEHDNGCDGEVDSAIAYVHDEHGQLVMEAKRVSPDLVELWRYDYDLEGNLLLVETDRGGDGGIDYSIVYDRSSAERVVEERGYEDGTLTSVTATTTDDSGRVVLVEDHQHYCDGEVVFTGATVSVRTSFDLVEPGHVTIEIDGVDCAVADGVTDIRIERTFDTDGHIVFERTDGDSTTPGPPDGIWDLCIGYTYDEHGRLVMTSWDGGAEPCDLVVDSTATNILDEAGRLVRSENDLDADTIADDAIGYLYDPCGNRMSWTGLSTADDSALWIHTRDFSCWR